MAGVIVPLALTALPQIIAFVVALVHKLAPAAEVAHGAGTGPLKFADVFVAVQDALVKAHAAGQITGDLPSDDLVKLIIQTVVSSLKALGMLTSDPLPPVLPGSQTLSLEAGQVVTIKAV